MSKLLAPSETAKWLKERDDFLVLTHRRPDGDTLGCAGALVQGLREQGKSAYILYNPEITPRYSKCVKHYIAPEDYQPGCIISVDTATTGLFTKNAIKYADSVSLCIDHHISNSFYAENTCLNADRASCGEIVFDILMAMSGSVSSAAAERLYIALSTDTGCFSFGNTTANTLYVASVLVESGAPNKELNKKLFRTKTRGRIRMECALASELEFYFEDKVAIVSITKNMLETTGANEDDMDDVAALPGSIKGVCVGIVIREMSSTSDCKVSVRTRVPYDAQEICAHFGGGGHKLAAGYTMKKTVDDVKYELLGVLEPIFTE